MNPFNLNHWYWRVLLAIAIPFALVAWLLFVVYSITMIFPLLEWVIFKDKNFTLNWWADQFDRDLKEGRV